MHKMIEFICDELEELERKAEKDGRLTMQDLQTVDVLTRIKKNILKAEEMWEDSEYSNAGGGSYAYARGRGRGARRDSMGRYSREESGRSYEGGGSNRSYEGGGSNRRGGGGGRSNASYESGYSRAEDDFRMDLQELIQEAPNERVRQKMQALMNEM